MSPCSGTLSSNTTVRAGRRPPFGKPKRRSHRRDYRRIKEVQFKRDYTRALHGLAGGPCICQSIWREDRRSFSSWYAVVLVGDGKPPASSHFQVDSGSLDTSHESMQAAYWHKERSRVIGLVLETDKGHGTQSNRTAKMQKFVATDICCCCPLQGFI